MKRLRNLLCLFARKPESLYLVALQGKVVITTGTSKKDRVSMSPALARKLGDELKAFANIAEQYADGVQVQPQAQP